MITSLGPNPGAPRVSSEQCGRQAAVGERGASLIAAGRWTGGLRLRAALEHDAEKSPAQPQGNSRAGLGGVRRRPFIIGPDSTLILRHGKSSRLETIHGIISSRGTSSRIGLPFHHIGFPQSHRRTFATIPRPRRPPPGRIPRQSTAEPVRAEAEAKRAEEELRIPRNLVIDGTIIHHSEDSRGTPDRLRERRIL